MRLKAYLFGGPDVAGPAANLGLLLLRVFAGGTMAIAHGWGKVPPSEGLVQAVAGMGFPVPIVWAWAAALAELVGGALVALGLATRPAAWTVAITMGVAGLIQHAGDSFTTKELALVYGVVFVALALLGPGRLSLDATLRQGAAGGVAGKSPAPR